MKSIYKFMIFIIIVMIVMLILINIREDIKYSSEENAIPPIANEIKTTVKLYFIQGNELVEEKRTIISKDSHIENQIIKELIKGPRNKTLISPMPKNVKIISAETIEGIYYLNLSREFIDNNLWNTIDRRLIIWSIVNSVTELNYIKGVQFLIEGEKMTFDFEKYSLESPFMFSEDFIREDKNTPFGVIKEFLNNILTSRYDKAYTMLSDESRKSISFEDFKDIFSDYNNDLENYDIFTYHTQKFSNYVKVTVIYVFLEADGFDYNKKIEEDWKLVRENGMWKIVVID
ncbi:Sporulation and spore germination [Caminicella sporogenes DSM 14501]|uniref:Sporulation and spore germination n=1 Tax=Caminicella sporogenes DSM 14501 TaxID=1121266 RepID=A0A1M6LTU1_9FIRM|nr:GerMN domain-containing protein [Caminicella sporogenes]RKD27950.1 hypothetical protein BET04_02505 [Caminicella sporogenes]SHJ74619.1 Sporulation and spore germination [Caminicella sporogenes DSM 14501]